MSGEESVQHEDVSRLGGDGSLAFGIYNGVAIAIFALMSVQFLFPSNRLLPIDRRTASAVCATLVFATRRFMFSDTQISIAELVDWDVLLLLAAIMVVNHIVVHQKETKKLITTVQVLIQNNPVYGFWCVSACAFISSAFLTNDGCCLLLVEPILNAFATPESSTAVTIAQPQGQGQSRKRLDKKDSVYFLIALACSSNIGSALTYTGNPQNMIVSQDAISVLPPLDFLALQILPALISWVLTIGWLQLCWHSSQYERDSGKPFCGLVTVLAGLGPSSGSSSYLKLDKENNHDMETAAGGGGGGGAIMLSVSLETTDLEKNTFSMKTGVGSEDVADRGTTTRQGPTISSPMLALSVCGAPLTVPILSPLGGRCLELGANSNTAKSQSINETSSDLGTEAAAGGGALSLVVGSQAGEEIQSPRQKRLAERRESQPAPITYSIPSPLPFLALGLLAAMIIMIFVDVMSISALVCISAMIMVLVVVLGNHMRGQAVWKEDGVPSGEWALLTSAERIEVIGEFFEELFASIDYSLLVIFLGTFVVIANIQTTGIPETIWASLAGTKPFQSVKSIVTLSTFVLFSSQLLGNVALIQMAVPGVSALPDQQKRFAWAVLSFVATVGGNLTITGSAANIIVAEKAQRLGVEVNFWKHAAICFAVTCLSCAIGAAVISGLIAAGL